MLIGQPFRVVPDILVGQNYCRLISTRKIQELDNCEFILSRCLLGWTIHGKISSRIDGGSFLTIENSLNHCSRYSQNTNVINSMDKLVKEYFDLDALGVNLYVRVDANKKRALEILDKYSHRIGNQGKIRLLWRNDNELIPDSKINSLHRLHLLERKFDRDE